MQIGICSTPENLAGMMGPALAFCEGTVADVLRPREGEAAFARRLSAIHDTAVPVPAVNCFLPGDLKSTGPAVDQAALDDFVVTALARAAKAGVKTIVFGSGGSRRVPEGWAHEKATDQLADALLRWGPIAQEHGVRIAVEPLGRGECNILTSVDEAASLVRRVDHPGVRLLVDTYHMACNGEDAESIRRAGELIVHVHCAERDGRGPLGTVGEDQRHYFRALKDVGYDGPLSIEAGWKDLASQLPAALKELQTQWETA